MTFMMVWWGKNSGWHRGAAGVQCVLCAWLEWSDLIDTNDHLWHCIEQSSTCLWASVPQEGAACVPNSAALLPQHAQIGPWVQSSSQIPPRSHVRVSVGIATGYLALYCFTHVEGVCPVRWRALGSSHAPLQAMCWLCSTTHTLYMYATVSFSGG